jgi:hypothetical protein
VPVQPQRPKKAEETYDDALLSPSLHRIGAGKTLSEFFISSLSSPVSEDVLVPALEGLAALAKLPSFGAIEAQTVAKTCVHRMVGLRYRFGRQADNVAQFAPVFSIFANVDLHGRPQTTRYLCYCLFDVLLAHQRAGQ